MTDVSNCCCISDLSVNGFWGNFQVDNTTKSTYSNLFLAAPGTPEGIATLKPEPSPPWTLYGGLGWLCSRNGQMIQNYNSTFLSGLALHISPSATGHAALNAYTVDSTKDSWWASLSHGFYVQSLSIPLSFNVQNPGSYYACTDDNGEIGVYFRLNNATTPSECEDILLYPISS